MRSPHGLSVGPSQFSEPVYELPEDELVVRLLSPATRRPGTHSAARTRRTSSSDGPRLLPATMGSQRSMRLKRSVGTRRTEGTGSTVSSTKPSASVPAIQNGCRSTRRRRSPRLIAGG